MLEAITLVVFIGFATFCLHESLKRHGLLGMGLVLVGIVIAQLSSSPRTTATAWAQTRPLAKTYIVSFIILCAGPILAWPWGLIRLRRHNGNSA